VFDTEADATNGSARCGSINRMVDTEARDGLPDGMQKIPRLEAEQSLNPIQKSLSTCWYLIVWVSLYKALEWSKIASRAP